VQYISVTGIRNAYLGIAPTAQKTFQLFCYQYLAPKRAVFFEKNKDEDR
jgi:hypothetical protein